MSNRADDHATFMTAMGEPVGLSVSDAPLPPLSAPLPAHASMPPPSARSTSPPAR